MWARSPAGPEWRGSLGAWRSVFPGRAGVSMARTYQDVALDAFAQDFEVWQHKEAAINIMQIPDDGPFHKERIWYRQFYNPRDKAAEFHRRVNGVHTTIDKRPGAKSKAA